MTMYWPQLLSRERLGAENASDVDSVRTDFQRDFDRIVFSSAFRRMQDKTQVFPLSKVDYVRTRLTHSLEASSVGRSLGTMVGEVVITRHCLSGFEASDFGDICAAASLAHDIGNPPFSHSGEDAIRHWAACADYGQRRVGILQESKREDFLRFEGNAQGFRVVTRLQNSDNPGGLQLTCATLAAFTKYPREAWLGGNRFDGASMGKHGFTVQDRDLFDEVATQTGLIRRMPNVSAWFRHPLAFLVEAADDICYRVIDIEDGYRMGYLGYDEVEALLLPLVQERTQQEARLRCLRGDKERVESLRAKAINSMIWQCLETFLDNETAILAGRFDVPLLDQIEKQVEMRRLIEVAQKRIYCVPEVVEMEAAGFQVIGELLERFTQVLDDIADHGTAAKPRSVMTQYLIPEQFIGPDRIPSPDTYSRLLGLTDFVAGMTDSYAVSLYKKLTGISLPSG